MKIIISLFASAFVATMAIAQEESASPAETAAPATEEKASATVESTPSAATAPTGVQKKEEPTSAAPATATGTQKKEAPTAAAKPAAAAAPAAAAPSGKNLTGEAAIKDMENRWEAAVGSHTVSTIEGFVAADFEGVSSKGKFINRSQLLSEFKGDKDTYKTAKNEKLNIRMLGPNVAVVTGRAREIGTGKDGKAFDRAFLFTDTWMMRGGKWQCVASHVSKIKG